MSAIKISQLWIYPIKSMKGISLKSSDIDCKGLKYDRQWMLVDENNQFLSQRRYSQMALFSVKLYESGLLVSYPDMDDLIIPFIDEKAINNNFIKVQVWDDLCDSIHINQLYDKWFSKALGISCKLVFLPDSSSRVVDSNYTSKKETTRFSDGFPLLLLSEESLSDLNHRLIKNNAHEISTQHFRPNIVIKGCKPYAEDNWTEFTVGKIKFHVVKPCTRCVITTIDPETGLTSGKEPLKTLNSYRRQGQKVIFGQNMLCEFKDEINSKIRINDIVNFPENSNEKPVF
ncbi:MAG: MOSC domain-containing protein [Gammaproteobacteria bacterium]|nr:MOSC domain-containing protein [Gammaproteobacteria bacterium]